MKIEFTVLRFSNSTIHLILKCILYTICKSNHFSHSEVINSVFLRLHTAFFLHLFKRCMTFNNNSLQGYSPRYYKKRMNRIKV